MNHLILVVDYRPLVAHPTSPSTAPSTHQSIRLNRFFRRLILTTLVKPLILSLLTKRKVSTANFQMFELRYSFILISIFPLFRLSSITRSVIATDLGGACKYSYWYSGSRWEVSYREEFFTQQNIIK